MTATGLSLWLSGSGQSCQEPVAGAYHGFWFGRSGSWRKEVPGNVAAVNEPRSKCALLHAVYYYYLIKSAGASAVLISIIQLSGMARVRVVLGMCVRL
jgi:hypothetical protein